MVVEMLSLCSMFKKERNSIYLKKNNITQHFLHSRFYILSEMLDDDADFNVPVDIFAIGFEEIVDLSAGNIVSARFAIS